MEIINTENLWRKFGVIAAILGFIVDIVAFFQIFGFRVIFSPTPSNGLNEPIISLKIPTDIETITFLIWLYSSVVFIVIAKKYEYDFEYSFPFIPLLLSALPVILLVVWLWGFRYISSWLYILLLPTTGYLAMSWYVGTTASYHFDKALLIISGISFGLTIIWFRSNFDWDFLVIVGTALASCLMGNGIGNSIGNREFDFFYWLKEGIEGFK